MFEARTKTIFQEALLFFSWTSDRLADVGWPNNRDSFVAGHPSMLSLLMDIVLFNYTHWLLEIKSIKYNFLRWRRVIN